LLGDKLLNKAMVARLFAAVLLLDFWSLLLLLLLLLLFELELRALATTIVVNKLFVLLLPPPLLEKKPPCEPPFPFSPPVKATAVAAPLPSDETSAVSPADIPLLRSIATAARGSIFPEVTEDNNTAFFRGSLLLS
jgi:hypothetical protein